MQRAITSTSLLVAMILLISAHAACAWSSRASQTDNDIQNLVTANKFYHGSSVILAGLITWLILNIRNRGLKPL